jgi:hypothetical protein
MGKTSFGVRQQGDIEADNGVVLCFGIPIILLYGLLNVEMVWPKNMKPHPSTLQLNKNRLINYTPQATMVRLLTINACNAYITAGVLSFAGGFRDPRLLLPGWIGIATVRPITPPPNPTPTDQTTPRLSQSCTTSHTKRSTSAKRRRPL